jgi:hypothetical protein
MRRADLGGYTNKRALQGERRAIRPAILRGDGTVGLEQKGPAAVAACQRRANRAALFYGSEG